MQKIILFVLFYLITGPSWAQESPYLGQDPPGETAQVFAPNFISQPNLYEFGSVFNRSGDVFYFAVNLRGKEEIRVSYLLEGKWTEPQTLLSHPEYGFNDPFLFRDEQRLYFISQRPLKGEGPNKDYDIWYVERQGDGWGKPINAGPKINTPGEEYYISFTESGRMYFASNREEGNFDIYYADFVDGEFQAPIRMSEAINSEYYEGDVFIDPQERYIIFCADRPDGRGRGDLYISFPKIGGGWSQAQNMGNAVNSAGHELCPFVSPDGAYLFYTSRMDIYWISTSIIETLRAQE